MQYKYSVNKNISKIYLYNAYYDNTWKYVYTVRVQQKNTNESLAINYDFIEHCNESHSK